MARASVRESGSVASTSLMSLACWMAATLAALIRWSSSELRAKKNVASVSPMPPSSAMTPKNSVTLVLRRRDRRRTIGSSVAPTGMEMPIGVAIGVAPGQPCWPVDLGEFPRCR